MVLSGVTFHYADGSLTVRGDDTANEIRLSDAGTVQVFDGNSSIDTGVNTGDLTRLSVYAGAGDDVVEIQSVFPVVARVFGHDGNDTLIGSDAADYLYGQAGDDVLIGNGSNDVLVGGLGADRMEGNDGDDRVHIDETDTAVSGDQGRDSVTARSSGGGVNIDMAAGSFEIAYGSDHPDEITAAGASASVSIFGYQGADVLTGSDFNDVIYGHEGDDEIRAGKGNDSVVPGPGADRTSGEDGDDRILVDSDDIEFDGGDGRDTADARRSSQGVNIDMAAANLEVAYGSDRDDDISAIGATERVSIYGYEGNDTLTGSDFNDVIYGYEGDDEIRAGKGNDSVVPGPGADTTFGEDGDDRILVDSDDIEFDGGDGRDTADARRSSQGVTIDMAAANLEVAYGSDWDDEISAIGATERVSIYGYAGNDTLTGSDFNDVIYGYEGDDEIRAGKGNDSVVPGPGADTTFGEDGDDRILVDSDDIQVDGGDGRDSADARGAAQGVTIDMTAANLEVAYGSDWDDEISAIGALEGVYIFGYEGNDTLIGSDFADVIYGHDGDDEILGNGGNNSLVGNDGADTLRGGGDGDYLQIDGDDRVIDSGAGRDRIDARRSSTPVVIDLVAAQGEVYLGSQHSDTIYSISPTASSTIVTSGNGNTIWASPRRNPVTHFSTATTSVYGSGTDSLKFVEPSLAESIDRPRASGVGQILTSQFGAINYSIPTVELLESDSHPGFNLQATTEGILLSNDIFADGAIQLPAVQLNGGSVRVTLQNTSSEDITIESISALGDFDADFNIKGSFEDGGSATPLFPRTISAGEGIAFDLAYSDLTPGLAFGTLQIESSDTNLPQLAIPIRGEVLYEPNVHVLAGDSGVDLSDETAIIDFGTFPAGETAIIPLTVYNREFQPVTVDPAEAYSTAEFHLANKFEFEGGEQGGTIKLPNDFEFTLIDILGLHPVGRPEFTLSLAIDQPATPESPGVIRLDRTGGDAIEFRYTIDFADSRSLIVQDDLGRLVYAGSSSRSFGSVASIPDVTVDKNRTFTITNQATTSKTIESINVVGDFQLTSPEIPIGGQSLSPGESLQVEVTATGTATELGRKRRDSDYRRRRLRIRTFRTVVCTIRFRRANR